MRKYYDEMDILRGLAITSVILIHISSLAIDFSTNGSFLEGFVIFINQSSRYAVPAFLFLSGFGLTISKKSQQGYFAFLWGRISKIILLYFIWNVFYYVFSFQSFSILGFLKGVILGSNYYHLYYVPLIIFFYVVYPFVLKVGKTNYGLMIILLISIISQISDIFTGIGILNDARNVFNWAIYFVLGIWLASNYEAKIERIKNRKSLLIVLLSTTVFAVFLETYILIEEIGKSLSTTSMRPSIILLTVLFIAVVICINWKDNLLKNMILYIAKKSYGIYLSHALILTIYNLFFAKLGFSVGSITYVLSAFLIVTFLSILVTLVMDKAIMLISNIFKKKELSASAH